MSAITFAVLRYAAGGGERPFFFCCQERERVVELAVTERDHRRFRTLGRELRLDDVGSIAAEEGVVERDEAASRGKSVVEERREERSILHVVTSDKN